jgi:hypothetical protein
MRWRSFHCTSFGHRENTEASLFFFFFFFFLCSSYAFAFYKGGGGGNKGKMTFCVFNILIAFIILVRFQ